MTEAVHLAARRSGDHNNDKFPNHKDNNDRIRTTDRKALVEQTLHDLRATFDASGHLPSPEMWAALRQVVDNLAAQAEGEAVPAFYLSSLDPGVGKTQAVVHFLRVLLADLAFKDVGVLILVSRRQEIAAYVRDAKLDPTQYAVFTGDEELNRLSETPHQSARVLFTTQQMLLLRARKTLNESPEFHFGNQPRSVRIWDEAMLPAEAIVVHCDEIASLYKALRASRDRDADALEAFVADLKKKEDRAVPRVIELDRDALSPYCDPFSKHPEKLPNEEAATLRKLLLLSGSLVTLRTHGAKGRVIVDQRPNLPRDLAPLLILDASGRVRETYRLWERERGNLIRLQSATKRYDNLTVHLWTRSAGKDAFRKDKGALLGGIADVINREPSERWLVVFHKLPPAIDLQGGLTELLTDDARRNVACITWGMHHGINDYARYTRIVLAGVMQCSLGSAEALARAAAGRSTRRGKPKAKTLRRVTSGETRHAMLQALCRICVRFAIGDQCHPAHAYIIGPRKRRLDKEARRTFPGAMVLPWNRKSDGPTGRVRQLIDLIASHFGSSTKGLRAMTLYRAIGMSKSNFKTNVVDHEEFQKWMAQEGITHHRGRFTLTESHVKCDRKGATSAQVGRCSNA